MFEHDDVFKLDVDPEWLEGMEIQDIIISPIQPEFGVLVLSKNYRPRSKNITIRIFSLMKTDENQYFPYHEMQSFCFRTFDQAEEFINRLPDMTGLDMLFLLNSPYNVQTS